MSEHDSEETYEDYKSRQQDDEASPPVEIPIEALSEQALNGVIDNFIVREGTDYGVAEVAYETKVAQIRRQLDKGDVKIVFDPASESVTLMTKREWQRALMSSSDN